MQSSRRGFLALGSAGVAAAMIDEAAAQSTVSGPNVIKSPKVNLFADIRDFREAKARLTTELANTELAEWLKTFSKSVDEHSIDALKSGGNTILTSFRFIYEPQHIEDLLVSASSLLDQALAYRNGLASLEISGVSAALQYLVTTNTVHIQDTLAEISSQAKKAEVVAKYEADAAKNYDDRGDEAHARGQAEVAKLTASQEAAKLVLLKQQNSLLLDAQQMMLKQLTAPGGGQNLSQRFLRTLKYYTEDLAEAYQKCLCVSSALPTVYGISDLNIPHFTLSSTNALVADWVADSLKQSPFGRVSGTALDALVDWCRRCIRKIEQIQKNEVEFTVSIPAVQGWTPGVAPAARTPLVGATVLKDAMKDLGSGVITFPLKAEHLSEEPLTNIRVLAVGVNVIGANRNYIYSCSVSGPKQRNTLIGSGYQRSPTFLGRVRTTVTPDNSIIEPELIFANTCHNLNPVGDWRVKINSRAIKVDDLNPASPARVDNQITEVFLHMRIRATYAA